MTNQRPVISLIAAVAENYVIGRDDDLPWSLPADLRWFVRQTRNKPIVFGRRTYESTGFLKSRKNIVVTRQRDYTDERAVIVHSLDEALDEAKDAPEVMILGGATIYEEMLPLADRFYLTVIHARPDGDTRFPAFDSAQWTVTLEEYREPDDDNPLPMTFFILERLDYDDVDVSHDLVPERFRRD